MIASQRVAWTRKLSAALVALMGVVNVGVALLAHGTVGSHTVHVLLRDLLPMTVNGVSRSFALLAGFALLLLASGLWRGKRVARWLTVALLALAVLINLLLDGDWADALSAAGLSALLLWYPAAFHRHSDPPTLRRVPLLICGGILAIAGYALCGFTLIHGFQHFTPLGMLRETLAQLSFTDGPYAHLVRGHAAWFLTSIRLLAMGLVTLTLLAILRPVLPRSLPACDRRQADALRSRFATSSLAPFALDADKQIYVGEQVSGFVAYRVAHGVAVVCGDPIAASDAVGPLAREFTAFCARQDWQVCFYEVQATHLTDYAPLGLAAVKIAEEAWVALPGFSLRGAAMSDVRHAVNKVVRDGTTWRWLDEEHIAHFWPQIQAIEARAQTRANALRLGFSLGSLPAQPDNGRYAVALGADAATVHAFCRLLPIPAVAGWALDSFRRGEGCPNGTMEFLIARVLEGLRDEGAAWCTLGAVPLADFGPPATTLAGRGLRALQANPHVNAVYGYQSLLFFKRKFNPEWRSAYLLYPKRLALPRVLTAVARVHVPGLGVRAMIQLARREPLAARAPQPKVG